MNIVIDKGHAAGTGARGYISERSVIEAAADLLRARLEKLGHQVSVVDFPWLTNAADLARSIETVNAGGYELCISLHADCSDNKTARGGHVCYYSLKGYTLAVEIADRFCPMMPGRAEKTVRRRDLGILRSTKPVSVLIELGFVSNEKDAEKLSDPQYLSRLVVEIADGIQFYIEHVAQAV